MSHSQTILSRDERTGEDGNLDGAKWVTNRVRKTAPLGDHSYWCPKCDASFVHEGGRCPACGFHDRKSKHAKP